MAQEGREIDYRAFVEQFERLAAAEKEIWEAERMADAEVCT